MAQRLGGRSLEQIRERSDRMVQRWADLREAEIVPLHLPNSDMEPYAVVRALMHAGLNLTYDTKRNAIVLFSTESLPPAS